MRRDVNRSVAAAFAAVALTMPLCLVASCGGGEGRLAKLRTDPMATYELPSAVTSSTSEMAGGFSDVSSPSTITRRFTVAPGQVEAAIAEIAAAAAESGWTLHDLEPLGFGGDKRIEDVSAQILITGIPADDIVRFDISSGGKR
jgi:hypothetical protein